MKKLLFLCLLMPVFAYGQDSLKIRQIIEKAMQTMNLNCYGLDYNLVCNDVYDVHHTKYITCKTIFDTTNSLQKKWTELPIQSIWLESKDFTSNKQAVQPEFHKINFFDKKTDTSIIWDVNQNFMTVNKYDWEYISKLSILSGYWNNYFEYAVIRLKNAMDINPLRFSNKKDTILIDENRRITYPIDSVLAYKGITKVNGKTCYVIEQIQYSNYQCKVQTYRYPDCKEGAYKSQFDYTYFYIDTANYIVKRILSFDKTNEQDTIFYYNVVLNDFEIKNYSEIDFNPRNVQKILWLGAYNDSCTKLIIHDIKGKAPNVTGIDVNNNSFSLYKQKGKCYVLDFMFANCGYCIKEALPYWKTMSAKYNSPNIQYFIINPIDNIDKIKWVIQKNDIQIPVIQDKKAAKNYAISSYPSCYILDENFNVLFSGLDLSECEKKEVEKILASYQNDHK